MARVHSRKALHNILSDMDGIHVAVHETATEVASVAEQRLAGNRDTGAAEITVTQGTKGKDSFVNLVDDAALSIEFGHKHNKTGQPVAGLYIITGAAGLA